MATKKGTKALTELLNIQGIKVTQMNQLPGIGIILQVESDASRELSSKPSGLKKLGIDEIPLIKGQGNYCAVLIDLEISKLITIVKGRTQEEIEPVLNSWASEVLEKIEEVSIDLWKGHKTLVKKLMPNVQVVANRFPVMVQVNNELDKERKREKRQVVDLSKKSLIT